MENFSSEEDDSSKDAKVLRLRWWFRRWENDWEVDSMVCAADKRPEREGHEEVRETKARNVPIGP